MSFPLRRLASISRDSCSSSLKVSRAFLLSSLRPDAQVFGTTASDSVAGQSTLLWGITPVLTSMSQMSSALSAASQIEELEHLLVDRGLVASGATVVFVNVSTALNRTDANFVSVQRIG